MKRIATFGSGIVLAAVFAARGVGAQSPVAAGDRPAPNRDAGALLDRKVTVDLTRVPLDVAIRTLAVRANTVVQYRAEVVERYGRPVTLRAKGVSLREAFARVLAGTTLHVVGRQNNRLVIVDGALGGDTTVAPAAQGDGVVRGTVTDSATGQGVAGVTVRTEGRGPAAVTAADGRFTLRGVPVGERTVTARRLGYQLASRVVNVGAGDSVVVRLVLRPAATALSGVVTTAVGTQRRIEVGTDITTLNADSIRKIAPVSTVTDLLENRVPGLVVQRASGAPGAPARLRIRGIASISASNDPIIVVDGVRRYSNQTTDEAAARFSVLDNIDVNSIATIDVLKGPSASALYGSDAANGVIVITTKRGQEGKTRWAFSTDQQRTTQPRTFPTLYYRAGEVFNDGSGARVGCRVAHTASSVDGCVRDTLFVLNPLSDARTTVLGTGSNQTYAASVSGGSAALQYFLGGQWSADVGLLTMSAADVAYLEQLTKAEVPRWQRRPQSAARTGGTARVTMQVTPALAVNLTSQLTRSTRSSTPLENAVGKYLGATFTPADTSLVTGGILDFRRRTTDQELNASHTANADWRPVAWWNTAADVGYQTLARETRTLLRRGDCVPNANVFGGGGCSAGGDDIGQLSDARSTPTTGTANLRSTLQLPSRAGVRFTPTLGLNYKRETMSTISYGAGDLPLGGTTNVGAKDVLLGPEQSSMGVQLGAFANLGAAVSIPGSNVPLYWTAGVRRDGSNAVGRNVKPIFPKQELSFPVSALSFFPFKRAVNVLRLRTAYGHSAVQPGLGERDRTYRYDSQGDAGFVVLTNPRLGSLGNPDLRPERSTEWEGGFDLGLWNDRVALAVTGSRKLSRDALETAALPLSVGGGNLTINIGSVRNTSTELDLRVTPVQRNAVRWDVHGMYSRTRNVLTKYAPDATGGVLLGQVLPGVGQLSDLFYTTRLVEGYPLNGVWLRPVVRWADVNGDGILQDNEMVRSDSSSFVGGPLPNYEASFDTQLGLWRGWVTLSAAFSYQNGMSQANQTVLSQLASNTGSTLRVYNDPTMPVAEQAAVLSGFAALHTVSALRFQAFSLRATLPAVVTRRLRASAASVALQGNNLGLWTTYSGSDPNVTGSIVGNQLYDPGVLPQPRTWGLNVSLSY